MPGDVVEANSLSTVEAVGTPRLTNRHFSGRQRAARVSRARVTPEEKLLIVRGLKEAGDIVAMTGEG